MPAQKATRKAVAVAVSLLCCLVGLNELRVWAQARAQSAPRPRAAGATSAPVPVYRVDPFWPKPLPNNWLIQGVPTMVADRNDHIWVLNRPRDIAPDESGAGTVPPRTDCCLPAPAVLEFDSAGNLLNAWGGPGHHPDWPAPGIDRPGPAAEHAIAVDREGNVWISGNARGAVLQKYTPDGKFLWSFGHQGPKTPPGQTPAPLKENNQETDVFRMGVYMFTLDEDAREIFIVDQKRVLVYGYDGQFRRGWGARGIPLSAIDNDPVPAYDWKAGAPPEYKQLVPQLHCIHLSQDGLVYVCERSSDRVQVFTKQGKFVTNYVVHGTTPARGPECGAPRTALFGVFGMCGTVWNITFSHDASQKYVLVADGTNNKVWILDRTTGMPAGAIGNNGRMAGQFHWIDAVATDSLGNLYTGEVDTGKRVQKFVLTNGDGVRRTRPHD